MVLTLAGNQGRDHPGMLSVERMRRGAVEWLPDAQTWDLRINSHPLEVANCDFKIASC